MPALQKRTILTEDHFSDIRPESAQPATDNNIAVHLVGKDSLFKEGVKSMLAKTDFQLTGNYEDAENMPENLACAGSVQIVVGIDEEKSGDVFKAIRTLKSRYSRSKVVIVSAVADMPRVTAAFSAGIDGYLLKNISCEGLVGSLKLVMSGERVCPVSMLGGMTTYPGGSINNIRNFSINGHRLSGREIEIIRRLSGGEPNKVIAANLNIAEATVKVHVKTILRKLGASNRTQAAIMAISQGIADIPENLAAQCI